MCLLDSAIGAMSALCLELVTMRRNVGRWQSGVRWDGVFIRRNVGQNGMSPNRQGLLENRQPLRFMGSIQKLEFFSSLVWIIKWITILLMSLPLPYAVGAGTFWRLDALSLLARKQIHLVLGFYHNKASKDTYSTILPLNSATSFFRTIHTPFIVSTLSTKISQSLVVTPTS